MARTDRLDEKCKGHRQHAHPSECLADRARSGWDLLRHVATDINSQESLAQRRAVQTRGIGLPVGKPTAPHQQDHPQSDGGTRRFMGSTSTVQKHEQKDQRPCRSPGRQPGCQTLRRLRTRWGAGCISQRLDLGGFEWVHIRTERPPAIQHADGPVIAPMPSGGFSRPSPRHASLPC